MTDVTQIPQLSSFEEGAELARMMEAGEVPPTKMAAAHAALEDLRNRLESQEQQTAQERLQEENETRKADLRRAFDLVAENPVGSPARDPRASTGLLGRVTPPGPGEGFVLANQARDRGVDIDSGVPVSERFGQGLASLKDPQLKHIMLDSHFRKQLEDSGVAWPATVPVVMLDEQTGRLMVARPITLDDVDNLGDDPNNVGKVRMTLVDPQGFDIGDLAEFLPVAPVVAGQVTASIAIGGATRSPALANVGSSLATAAIEGIASPIKDKLLKEYYGVTEEQLKAFSDPNEALNQAMFAGGLEFGLGQAMIMTRWLRNQGSKRTLTEEDYKALTEELDEVRKIQAEFREVTGESIEDPLMFVEAAGKRLDTATGQSITTKGVQFLKRLPEKMRRVWVNTTDVMRNRVQRGFRTILNRSAMESTDDYARVGLDENGLVMPIDDVTSNARDIARSLEDDFGVTTARRNVDQGTDEAMQQMDMLADASDPAHFIDVQRIASHDVAAAAANEELQWAFFKDMLEPNSRGVPGIHLANEGNTPVKQALANINNEGVANYSRTLGDESQRFVQDLQSLQNGTLDIVQMNRLRSDLLAAIRRQERGENLGWKTEEIRTIVDAMESQIIDGTWVRSATGRAVPAIQKRGIMALQNARESSRYYNTVAQRRTIQDLTDTIEIFDDAAKSFTAATGRRKFSMMPQQARDMIFRPGDASALRDVIDLSGRNPNFRAAMADQLEGIYKQMVLNADGTFKAGGFQQFRAQFGDHMDLVFGPENAARITHADQMVHHVAKLNKTADAVMDSFRKNFGDAFESGSGANGLVRHMLGSSNVTRAQVQNVMRDIARLDPGMHAAVRAEFSQWAYTQLSRSPVALKDGNALRTWLSNNRPKVSAIMGSQFTNDMDKVIRATDILDLSDLAKGTSEPIQAAWLQITRSVFGPLSRKQRFMTAANRIMRARGAQKAIELMSDPRSLRQFVHLGTLDPQSLAFWQTVNALGLRGIAQESGLVPPHDLEQIAAREQSLRNLMQGGPQ